MSDSGTRLVSDRLILREFVDTDEHAVHAFASDPVVTQFMTWGPNSIEDTRAFLREAVAQAVAYQLRSCGGGRRIAEADRQRSFVDHQH